MQLPQRSWTWHTCAPHGYVWKSSTQRVEVCNVLVISDVHCCEKHPNGYVWKLSTHSVTPLKGGNNDGDETFLESHTLTVLPLSPFLDSPTSLVAEVPVAPVVAQLRKSLWLQSWHSCGSPLAHLRTTWHTCAPHRLWLQSLRPSW